MRPRVEPQDARQPPYWAEERYRGVWYACTAGGYTVGTYENKDSALRAASNLREKERAR